ncbi:unnamed protein product [Mytilus edulis]|uniref:P2X purinoreceptor 7 intracellular domain-containing protein n=1 Tax=Mytilus edulis TaxID=6550 RepID=A0A8S3SFI3_MYTED|nr:unnamed protein product [Mytilus edulis]
MDREDKMGLVPYNFEPEYSVEEMNTNSVAEPTSQQAFPTLEEWCDCGNCQQMPSPEECVCCRHAEFVYPNLEDHQCITQIESFDNLILNPDVLALSFIQMMMFKRQRGRAPDQLNSSHPWGFIHLNINVNNAQSGTQDACIIFCIKSKEEREQIMEKQRELICKKLNEIKLKQNHSVCEPVQKKTRKSNSNNANHQNHDNVEETDFVVSKPSETYTLKSIALKAGQYIAVAYIDTWYPEEKTTRKHGCIGHVLFKEKRCHETDSSDSEDKYQYTHVNTGENSGISSSKSNYESNKDQGILSDDEMAACENDSISDSNQVSQSESELWNAIDQQIVISSDSGDNSEIPKSKQLTSWAKNWYEDGSSHPNFEMFYLQRDEIVTEGIIDLNAATEKLIQTVRERTELCKKARFSKDITATDMRHRAATLYSAMDIPEKERRLFYLHMGHSADMNRDVCQCPESVRITTSLGKALQCLDRGTKEAQSIVIMDWNNKLFITVPFNDEEVKYCKRNIRCNKHGTEKCSKM